MANLTEIILAAILLIDLALCASSRLLHCIKLVAAQGVLLGVLPLFDFAYGQTALPWTLPFFAVVNVLVKGVALPYLLNLAMRRAQVKRELEPLVGYAWSMLLGCAMIALAFWFGKKLAIPGAAVLATPTALSTMLIGLFIIIGRRKAITQVIGFLLFENGIAIFGAALAVEYGAVVELGILLDVFVLVFVMGIAVFQISREFEHIDADKLNQLGDVAKAVK